MNEIRGNVIWRLVIISALWMFYIFSCVELRCDAYRKQYRTPDQYIQYANLK